MKKTLKSFPNKTTHEKIMKKVLSNPFVITLIPNFVMMYNDDVVKREQA
jgi:hypothetical protein